MKKVVIVGLGYVGLPTAIVASDAGYEVLGFDIDDEKCRRIKSGDSTIVEPEIKERLAVALLRDSFQIDSIIRPADVFVVAVPTPLMDNAKADLRAVFNAIESIASVIKKGDTVIVESTISVGTTKRVANLLEERTSLRVEKDFYVAHCPERVLPGKIFYELEHNDRIIGGVGPKSSTKARKFYLKFVVGDMYQTDSYVAEMVKLVENSARDVQIALAHQVAEMAHAVGVDPFTVIALANKHPRVSILSPSAGVGGHCIAVDPWFLIESFPKQTELLQAARRVNNARTQSIIGRVRALIAGHDVQEGSSKPTVLLIGLTFKPDTNDVRNSPALEIAQTLQTDGNAKIVAFDPYISGEELQSYGLEYPNNLDQGIAIADIVVFLVKHSSIRVVQSLLEGKQTLDVCGALYNAYKIKPQGAFFAARWSDNGFAKESSLRGIQNEVEKR